MVNQTQNNMPEYVKNLPKKVQDFVFGSEWETRTLEIAKKYSLGEGQSDALANIVVLVLIGLEKPETFLQTIVTDLKISKLLAEQIVSDLETRVFDYAIKQIQTSKPIANKLQQTIPTPATSTQQPKPAPQANPVQNKVPEVRPVNVPMAKPAEASRPTQTESVFRVEKQPVQTVNEPAKPTMPAYTPPTPRTPEVAQRPVNVPRFTSTPAAPNTPSVATTPVNPVSNSIQNKLDTVVKTPPQPAAPKAPDRYAVDPYREPIN